MLLIVTTHFIPKGFRGLTVFPFVFIKFDGDRNNEVLIHHEKIHLRQQKEMLILPFYIWYGIEYTYRLFQYQNRNAAYQNISFEREAYAKEADLDYLKNRSFFAFLKFL